MKKKLLSLLLVLALVLALVPMTVFATEPHEAKIVNGSEYATLQEAVTAATDGQTIELLKNVTLENNDHIVVNKTGVAITLDLKGHELKGAYGTGHLSQDQSLGFGTAGLITIGHGKLTVKDTVGTGIIENTYSTSGNQDSSSQYAYSDLCAVGVFNEGKFVLESGTVKAVGHESTGSEAEAIVTLSSADASVTINGGKVVGFYAGIVSNAKDNADCVFINGGEITGYSGVVNVVGNLKMTAGTITSTGTGSNGCGIYGFGSVNSVFTISGGTINATYWGIGVNTSNIKTDNIVTISDNAQINQDISIGKVHGTISGGTITGKVYAQVDGVVSITGGNIGGIVEKAVTQTSGGTNNGDVQVSGGTFKEDPANYLLEGHTAPKVGEVWIVDYVEAKVAKVDETEYATLQAAVNAVSSAQTKTITLLADVADAGEVQLPAGATLDGDGHKITGNSNIKINAAGGTVQDVVFENIHDNATVSETYKNKYGLTRDTGTLTAIYGNSLSGTATVTGCTFDNIDWDAIQISPVAGATVNVTGNTFKHTADEPTIRYVHIQSGKDVDFTANVTDNKFYDCGKLVETGIEVYYPTDADKINCSGNYMDSPMAVCIGTGGTSYNNAYAEAFPFKDANLENDVKIAAIIERGNIYLYPTLAEAIAAAKAGETIQLIDDLTLDARVDISNNKTFTIDLNGHTIGSTATCANGSVFNLMSGNVTIENGKLVGIAGPTGLAAPYTNECDVITVRSGAVANLEDLHISVDSRTGACAYAFDGGKIYIKSGTYENFATEADVNGHTKAMLLNQADNKDQAIFVSGGTFRGENPANGDNSGKPATFLAKNYMSEYVEGNGAYVVKLATNKTNATVEEALQKTEEAKKTGATDEQKEAAKNAVVEAVQAVENIENSTLAENSNTMDNLKKLETALTQQREADNSVGDITAEKKDEATNITVNSVANAALSADLSVTDKDQKIEVKVENKTVEGESPAVTLDQINQAAQNKAKANVGEEKVVTEAPQDQTTPTVVPLDITMVRMEKAVDAEDTAYQQVGEPITEPTAPVVMTFDLPTGWQNCEVIYVNDAGQASDEKIPTVISDKQDGGKEATATFSHFSTYVLVQTAAEANPNEYEIILTPNKTDVSAGDEITFTVKLKHTTGSSATFGYFRYAPAPELADLLEYQSGSAESGVTYGKIGGTGAYEFAISTTKNLANGETMTLGTLTYKVKAYATDNTAVNVVAKSGEEASITNSTYQMEAGLKLTQDKDVTYHVTTVTFTYGDGTSETKYVKYNTAGVYDSLANMYAGTTGTVPSLTDDNKGNGSVSGGTQYRLKDTDWHLTNASGAAYDNSTSKFMANANYVVNRVELVEITIPNEVTVTSTKTTRGEGDNAKTYVDKGADLTFTVSAPTLGNKKNVTVKVSGNAVDSSPASVTDATTTVTATGTNITGPVTFEITETVDLTANDIKIFTKGTQGQENYAYLEYSVYSGTDTLVLIKGKANANYTLGSGQPQIFAIPDSAYGTGYTHAVLVPKQSTVSPEAMLTYLTGTCGLTATTTANTAVTYDWNTNGQSGAKLADVQATYDFQSLDTLNWTPTDALLLKADVMNLPTVDAGIAYENGSYTVARDAHVSAADVNAFLYLYAQLAQ